MHSLSNTAPYIHHFPSTCHRIYHTAASHPHTKIRCSPLPVEQADTRAQLSESITAAICGWHARKIAADGRHCGSAQPMLSTRRQRRGRMLRVSGAGATAGRPHTQGGGQHRLPMLLHRIPQVVAAILQKFPAQPEQSEASYSPRHERVFQGVAWQIRTVYWLSIYALALLGLCPAGYVILMT